MEGGKHARTTLISLFLGEVIAHKKKIGGKGCLFPHAKRLGCGKKGDVNKILIKNGAKMRK